MGWVLTKRLRIDWSGRGRHQEVEEWQEVAEPAGYTGKWLTPRGPENDRRPAHLKLRFARQGRVVHEKPLK